MAEYPRIRPIIDNPYPGEFQQVTDFQYTSRLVLAREPDVLLMRDKAKVSYIVDQDYTVTFKVDGADTSLTVQGHAHRSFIRSQGCAQHRRPGWSTPGGLDST